ncbi:MAG: hypothetical protein LBJ67_13225 [Planctomycetaceae bacterium]|jgi:hypothetical protein|nr:hypothetical protein [Planctomycetaceae bacterium]
MKKQISCFAILLLILCLASCNKNVGLNGKVIFSDDKSPVPCGTVCFDSGSVLSRGTIRSDGTFTMGSLKETDGLLPGTYNVFFIDAHEQTGTSNTSDGMPGEPIYTSLIHKKYLSANTSELTQTVETSTKELNFELDRNPDIAKK